MTTGRQAILHVSSTRGEMCIPFTPDSHPNVRELLLLAGLPLRGACGGQGGCGQCRIRLDTAPPPVVAEIEHLSADALAAGERLACQVYPQTDLQVYLPAFGARRWRMLDLHELPNPTGVLQPSSAARYGIAVDLGTTHIRLTLWDISLGQRVCGRIGDNPQTIYGADVLNRMMAATQSEAAARQLHTLMTSALREGAALLASDANILSSEIGKMVVVGNTAMLALLSGRNIAALLDPDNWVREIDIQPADKLQLLNDCGLERTAQLELVPTLGGFVGSDLLADIVASGLMQGPPGALLVDFGTNSEMALWDGSRLHVTSTAGGPAFEGSGISCGMAAMPGAVFRVNEQDGEAMIEIIGGGIALGICGSGLVDAIACWRRQGKLDRVGRAHGDLCLGKDDLVLQARDIDVFQRAKAAIGAGITWLCGRAGMHLADLQRVVACGAFGQVLDISNAQTIGLLPQVDKNKVELSGNAALIGCETWLLGPDRNGLGSMEEALEKIRHRVQLYNVAEDAEFEKLFVHNLYLEPLRD